MPTALIGGFFCVLLMTACAGIERAQQPEAPLAAPSGSNAAVGPKGAASLATSDPSQAKPIERESGAAPEQKAAPKVPTSSGTVGSSVIKPFAPTATARAPSPAAQVPSKQAPSKILAKPEAGPPLDLKSLETRLKETPAIGVFTKIALKNQVDDLLDRFRAFYQGRLKTSLVELRRSYDLLVLKVLALLQDADRSLASAIATSRESIWGILSDPAKFAAV